MSSTSDDNLVFYFPDTNKDGHGIDKISGGASMSLEVLKEDLKEEPALPNLTNMQTDLTIGKGQSLTRPPSGRLSYYLTLLIDCK